ncbi:MAG: hypothetical protein H0X25_16335 [Acidobacteriales bacterium]|nr:hypothetical protein [Terriglobales bacterium]
MEVTVTVSMTQSEPAVYTVNVYEDAPCWRAQPVSFRELVEPEAEEVLQPLGVPANQALALVSSIPGPLVIVKLKLALQSEHMELLSCRSQLAAA